MHQSNYSTISAINTKRESTIPILAVGQPSLGILADGSSTPAEQTENPGQVRRFQLLKTARNLLPDERIADCQHAIAPNFSAVAVEVDADQESAHFRNLIRCESPQCPFCAVARSEDDRHQLSVAMAQAQNDGMFPVLLTFTLRHQNSDTLDSLQKSLRTAFNKTFSGRWYQDFKQRWEVVGKVTTRECTYGRNGWHPHLHILMFLRLELTERWTGEMQAEIATRWAEKLQISGFTANLVHGVDVRTADSDIADYIAKFGREPTSSTWGADTELAKANVKRASLGGLTPFQLLGAAAGIADDLNAAILMIDGDRAAVRRKAGMLYAEFFRTMKGKPRLSWGDMKRILELDDALHLFAQENPEPERDTWDMALIQSGPDWKTITGGNGGPDLRADLLAVCATRNAGRVNAWLIKNGITGGVPPNAFERSIEAVRSEEMLQ